MSTVTIMMNWRSSHWIIPIPHPSEVTYLNMENSKIGTLI